MTRSTASGRLRPNGGDRCLDIPSLVEQVRREAVSAQGRNRRNGQDAGWPHQTPGRSRYREPLAKKSVGRQIAEWDGKRDCLRQALEGVAVQAVDDIDKLMADCRRAFLEAKADFAGLMTPAQVNRFVAEIVGPMEVLPDGSVRQKEKTVDSDELSTVAIEGEGWSDDLCFRDPETKRPDVRDRRVPGARSDRFRRPETGPGSL